MILISRLVEKLPAFHGNRRFFTVFTTARHMALSWARSPQSTHSQQNYLRFIAILSSHLHLRRPSRLFPSCFSTTTLYAPLLSPTHVTCCAHFIVLYLITRKIFSEEYKSWTSLWNFLQSHVSSSLLSLNTFLSTQFSKTLTPCSSLSVRGQVSQPYKSAMTILYEILRNYTVIQKLYSCQIWQFYSC